MANKVSPTNFDFAGWATVNDLKCSDGRTIRKDAFIENDRQIVPIVWNHRHNEPSNVLGHALLINQPKGVYTYGLFNDTESGQNAKELVMHGDISNLSIYANQLKERGGDVLHGKIREVSLVLAGANPGAYIDRIMAHGEDSEDGAICYTDEMISLRHALKDDDEDDEEEGIDKKDVDEEEGDSKDSEEAEEKKEDPKKKKESLEHADEEKEKKDVADKEKTLKEVFDTLTEEQKTAVYAIVGMAAEGGKDDDEEEKNVKHNVFDNDEVYTGGALSHADMEQIFADAKRLGSLRDAVEYHAENGVLAHAVYNHNPDGSQGSEQTYGMADIDWLFPDAKTLQNAPEFIRRNSEWVNKFMNATHHTPFSRIKSVFADITMDEARAKGYIKTHQKAEEVFALLKRVTTPTTIYKKQKLDRDDIIDIVDFDVVAWLKTEMRWMLDEEIARAALVGDGRSPASNDKISELNIRPIWTDDDLFTVKVPVTIAANATDDDKAKAFIKAAIKSRKNYKGTGTPSLFTTEDMLTDMLLLTDEMGRDLYDSVDKLATKLRVKEIVTVEVMENLTRTVSGSTRALGGIIVNPADYNFGADKGGAVSMFDDFDIDYNQQKYLIETRCSGALTKPYSALAVEFVTGSNDTEGE